MQPQKKKKKKKKKKKRARQGKKPTISNIFHVKYELQSTHGYISVLTCRGYLTHWFVINLNHSLRKFSRQQTDAFNLILSQKIWFDNSCKLSLTICVKCQSIFLKKQGKKSNCHLLKFLLSMFSIEVLHCKYNAVRYGNWLFCVL